jgi:hypothetical protein
MSRWHEDCPYDSTSGLRNWSCRATTTAISVSPSNKAYHQSKSCRQEVTPAMCTLRTGAVMFRQLVCHHHLKRACPGEIDHSDKRTPQRVTISSHPPVGRLRDRCCCEPRYCNFGAVLVELPVSVGIRHGKFSARRSKTSLGSGVIELQEKNTVGIVDSGVSLSGKFCS